MTTINTLSNAALADEIGLVNDEIKALQEKLAALKDEAKSRGITEVVGSFFSVKFTNSIAATLDTATLKKEFGQKWYDDHCKLAERTTCYIKPVAGAISNLVAE